MKIFDGMKKILLFLLALILGSFSLFSQNVIRGRVLDEKGLPIPGARVSVKDGTESVLSDFDGAYSLETVTAVSKITVDYVGFNSRTVKVQPGLTDVTLQKMNLWNKVPSKLSWMVSLQTAFPESFEQPSLGLMVGCVKKFGGYVKAAFGVFPGQETSTETHALKLDSPLNLVTAGLIVRLGSALHLTAGGGFASREVSLYVDDLGTSDLDSRDVLNQYSYSGAAIDCGLMLVLGRLNINAGTIVPLSAPDMCFIGNFGVGINF